MEPQNHATKRTNRGIVLCLFHGYSFIFNLNLKTILVSQSKAPSHTNNEPTPQVSHHDNITGRQCHGGRRYDSPLREEASGREMTPNGWCPVQIGRDSAGNRGLLIALLASEEDLLHFFYINSLSVNSFPCRSRSSYPSIRCNPIFDIRVEQPTA